MFGVVVSSSSPAVAARCARARAGVGAASSQNVTDPTLGPRLLDLLAEGMSAARAIEAVIASAPHIQHRQLTVVDRDGGAAAYSGTGTLGTHATHTGEDCVAAGNLLAHRGVPRAMTDAFERDPDADLGDRLLGALRAGLNAGGEEGPVRSCGLVMVDRVPWNQTDLRVDWHDDPITELEAIWAVWKPQAGAYVTRALDPTAAPSYGVPGDE
jgi:uncharacterized Ntn-hydrolase superfamily protein